MAFADSLLTKIASSSLELSLDIGDSWHQVDGSTSHKHGWLSTENLGGGTVDLIRGDSVDSITVLVESKVTVGLEVAGNFFKSFVLSLH